MFKFFVGLLLAVHVAGKLGYGFPLQCLLECCPQKIICVAGCLCSACKQYMYDVLLRPRHCLPVGIKPKDFQSFQSFLLHQYLCGIFLAFVHGYYVCQK